MPAAKKPHVHLHPVASASSGRSLRLLSYNVQVGIETRGYRDYVTRGWRHILPSSERSGNLDRIAQLVNQYDVVGLQEVDGGSLRSGFVNQVQYLAEQGQIPFWYSQLNRDLGRFGQHSNGLLSKYQPTEVRELRLPGLVPGRGALMVRYGSKQAPLIVVILHLALSKRAREQQLAAVCERVSDYQHVIMMGDLNCRARDLGELQAVKQANLFEPACGLKTFPSWQPQSNLDRVLVTPSIHVRSVRTIKCTYSDHLPIALEAEIPHSVRLRGPSTSQTAALLRKIA
jgi:endonuclease/exonuclease/phosphatase family metal-dependent hydrolase